MLRAEASFASQKFRDTPPSFFRGWVSVRGCFGRFLNFWGGNELGSIFVTWLDPIKHGGDLRRASTGDEDSRFRIGKTADSGLFLAGWLDSRVQ